MAKLSVLVSNPFPESLQASINKAWSTLLWCNSPFQEIEATLFELEGSLSKLVGHNGGMSLGEAMGSSNPAGLISLDKGQLRADGKKLHSTMDRTAEVMATLSSELLLFRTTDGILRSLCVRVNSDIQEFLGFAWKGSAKIGTREDRGLLRRMGIAST